MEIDIWNCQPSCMICSNQSTAHQQLSCKCNSKYRVHNQQQWSEPRICSAHGSWTILPCPQWDIDAGFQLITITSVFHSLKKGTNSVVPNHSSEMIVLSKLNQFISKSLDTGHWEHMEDLTQYNADPVCLRYVSDQFSSRTVVHIWLPNQWSTIFVLTVHRAIV